MKFVTNRYTGVGTTYILNKKILEFRELKLIEKEAIKHPLNLKELSLSNLRLLR